jgi:hypothetical protein
VRSSEDDNGDATEAAQPASHDAARAAEQKREKAAAAAAAATDKVREAFASGPSTSTASGRRSPAKDLGIPEEELIPLEQLRGA